MLIHQALATALIAIPLSFWLTARGAKSQEANPYSAWNLCSIRQQYAVTIIVFCFFEIIWFLVGLGIALLMKG